MLDFVEFLLSQTPKKKEFKHPDGRPMSALEAAGDLVGSVEGPGDLSTNKKYLQRPISAEKESFEKERSPLNKKSDRSCF